MKTRVWRWLAVVAAGGVMLQGTSSCTSDVISQLVAAGTSILIQVLVSALAGGLGT